MLPSETMIWQPEFTDKTLSRKPGAVHQACFPFYGKLGVFPIVWAMGSGFWRYHPGQISTPLY
ncbi:hypothetical protein [Escherichia coli]|uniref:hypothetical protein n=1 Tax=Escherichia coli TaxID=562 RepID=UPI000BE5EC21|nr:hypothetical protein [Escherichia coli]